MKNRKREETTKKTKRQTSEAKKSESEKGSCGSRGETKQKRSRNEAETGATRRRNAAGDQSREDSERRFSEKVWREGMERRVRAEIRRGGVEVRFEGQGMQRPAARGKNPEARAPAPPGARRQQHSGRRRLIPAVTAPAHILDMSRRGRPDLVLETRQRHRHRARLRPGSRLPPDAQQQLALRNHAPGMRQ